MRKPCDFSNMRGNDLIRAYHDCIRQNPDILSMDEIMIKVVNSPANKFWINPENATKLLMRIIKKKDISSMRPERMKMMKEIKRRYYGMKSQEKFRNYSAIHLITIICEQSAPSFYMEVSTAKKLFREAVKRKQPVRKARFQYL